MKLAEILFVSLLLINESSTEQRFSVTQPSPTFPPLADSAHGSGCSPELCDPRSAHHAAVFSH